MSSIKNNNTPLFKIEWQSGKNLSNESEGILYKNLFGTHLIGPILVRNPEFLKLIIQKICTNKDETFSYKDTRFLDEQKGYELVLSELEARKNLSNK